MGSNDPGTITMKVILSDPSFMKTRTDFICKKGHDIFNNDYM